MHFRCIDYLPLKQRGFKLICSKHQKKKKKAQVQFGHSLPSPWWKAAVCWISASFPQAPVRNAKPRQLLFGAFTSIFKNPETKSLLQSNPTRFASLEGRQKRPSAFCKVPCVQCRRWFHPAWDPFLFGKGTAGDSISAFNTLQLREIAFQYFLQLIILRQNLCWLNCSYLRNKCRARLLQRRRGWIPALKGETWSVWEYFSVKEGTG